MGRFHWGHGIFIFYTLFVLALLTALVASMKVDHTLVIDKYYEEDLKYQSHYDKMQNSKNAHNLSVKYDKEAKKIIFDFSDHSKVKGKIWFYRPSDKSKDFIVPLDSNTFEYDVANLLSGRWIVKIDWTQGGKSYYLEQDIYI